MTITTTYQIVSDTIQTALNEIQEYDQVLHSEGEANTMMPYNGTIYSVESYSNAALVRRMARQAAMRFRMEDHKFNLQGFFRACGLTKHGMLIGEHE